MTSLSTATEIADFVRAAPGPFEIVGGGTRRALGRPMGALPVLDVSGLSGILSYEPEELIVTARPGTPLGEIRQALADKGQCLGFDPADWSGLWQAGGTATLGGAVSSDASGPGRLRHGAARDSLLGFQAVNGRGEIFRAGGKVVKNVTGFDLPKLVCGAFGTLCVLTELTFRVYPRPRCSALLALPDINPAHGLAALRKVAHSALEASGLSYLPGTLASPLGDVGQGAALIRLEAAAAPLAEKVAMLKGLLGDAPLVDIPDGASLFTAIGNGALLGAGDLWRLLLPPSRAADVASRLNGAWLADWAGGLLWVEARAEDAAELRTLAAAQGGHAMLVRADAQTRAHFGLYAPQPPALAALSARVKSAFDPGGLFNPGRL
jgi:glycolate oxidase FAD binding subunit